MYQEKSISQDGRIILYPDYNIRVSSQKNVHRRKDSVKTFKEE